MKSIKSAASAASMASLDEKDNCRQVQPSPIQPPPPPAVVKTDVMVVKQQPKSVRSPSLPPMTLPLTLSNAPMGSSTVSENLCASNSASQFPLDEQQKNTRCGGKCSIL